MGNKKRATQNGSMSGTSSNAGPEAAAGLALPLPVRLPLPASGASSSAGRVPSIFISLANFDDIAILTLFVLPFAGLDATFDVDGRALLQVLADDLRRATKKTTRCHSVISLFSPDDLSLYVSVVCSPNRCNRFAVLRKRTSGSAFKVADEGDSVE